ncbi:polysaccharide biosynthesis C-terminal domain-containing protein [Burkholderia sp. 22PA0106]|uniref:oligosaccharide flippase family protein n=1 Tax=Burkholderia sp. 22PA0106 TaxID=3237371 RepID=UPI0039C19D17
MNRIKPTLSSFELFAVYLSYVSRYLYPLFLLPYYGRTLGAGGYAVILAGMSLSNSIWLFVNYGFSTVGARDTVHTQTDAERAAILRRQFSARLVLCVPGAIVGAIAATQSAIFARVPGIGVPVVAMGLVAAFNLGWYFASTGRAKKSVAIEVVGFVLSLSMIFCFIHRPGDLKFVFPLLLVSSVVQLGLAYWSVRREFSGLLSSPRDALGLIRQSTVIFIYGGTSVLLIGASTYVLSLLAPAAEVGAFGVAERLIGAGLSLMGPAAQILVPKVTFLVGRDAQRANLLARRIFAFFFGGATLATFVTVFAAGWVVPFIFGAGFAHAVPVLQLLAFVLPVSVCTQVLGMYFLIPRKREGLLARSGVISAIVNLACAVPLATHWGAMGMGVARLLGELTMLGVLLVGVWRAGLVAEIVGARRCAGSPAGL